MKYDHYDQWWNQNGDYPRINDESEIIIVGDQMTISCNDNKKTFTLIGIPTYNHEKVEVLEEYAINPDDPQMVEDAAEAYGCTVLEGNQ